MVSENIEDQENDIEVHLQALKSLSGRMHTDSNAAATIQDNVVILESMVRHFETLILASQTKESHV